MIAANARRRRTGTNVTGFIFTRCVYKEDRTDKKTGKIVVD